MAVSLEKDASGLEAAGQIETKHLDVAPSKLSSEQDHDHDHGFTKEEQRKIIRRIDRRLVITVGAMYCVSLMDRTNMSAANIAGMGVELALIDFRYVRGSGLIHIDAVDSMLTWLSLEHCQLGLLRPLYPLPASVYYPDPQDWPTIPPRHHHHDVGRRHDWYGFCQKVPPACCSPSGTGCVRGGILPQLCLSSEHMVHAM